MKQEKIKASWWAPRQDLETFRLAKFFSLTSFVVILVSTVILTFLLAHRGQRLALKKSEDYLKLLAANLNHQVFQQFLVPIAIEKQGRITIADPEQYQRLDAVVKNTIHGFHVEKLAIYDQVGVLSYSTSQVPLGKDCFDVPGVRQALFGEIYLDMPGKNLLLAGLAHWSGHDQRLTGYFPFRLESKDGPGLGPVVGVFEISQDITGDVAEITRFQFLTLISSVLVMGVLFLVLRQIVKQAEVIIERRQQEQLALEAQLNQAERLAALGEMTAGVAHEIRNPLGIISSTAELLRERLARYEPQNRLAQIIVEEANRLNEKVTEFLDFARPRTPNLQNCDLEKVLERSLELLQPEIDRLHIAVERHYQSNGQPQLADPDMLHQAFLNILLNALQAMPNGGRLKVSLGPGARGGGSRVRIEDSGEGIDPETMKKVFNPFFTTKEKGSGLGLPIVKSIIESHQGAIRIESQPGQGTAVTIDLPPLS
jgi:signal transduction histidine kinase|uniref:histidine kinase n=1 Tax=Desulfobacca acetoxidans TaxID=60893 RepID=A0A7C3WMP6_9BACT